MEAVSPVFVGHQKTGDVVAGYKLNDQPALPASSLRGLVASLAEAASNSALRVLTRKVLGQPCYSYRKRMQQPLSAIGMLWKEGDQWKLEPVCLPLLQFDRHGLKPNLNKWKSALPVPVFRVFEGDKDAIRRDADDLRDPAKNEFRLRTTSTAHGGIRVRTLRWDEVLTLNPGLPLNVKDGGSLRTVVAQNRERGEKVQPCLVRVLGCYEKNAEGGPLRKIPEGKHHELYLPYRANRFAKLTVQPDAMERFQQIADQMTEDSKGEGAPRPYEPKDTRPDRAEGDRLVPQTGDLVFFDIDDQLRVTEISYSSIWRGRVETLDGKAANAWTFFDKVDPELTPFHPGRAKVTLAERVFGLVEEKEGEELRNGLRLKGRVRFSPGLAAGEVPELPEVRLKELSSPKPPSPALYFREPQGGNSYIAKNKLKPGKYWPQGRKAYLHHPNAINGVAKPWENPGQFVPKRHVKISPWAKGSQWRFEIRFDNLNQLELGMVLYALSPCEEFRHKIGMGKPLGLGSIHMKVERVRLVNRERRYSADGWGESRYGADFAWQPLREEFRGGMIPEVRAAIEEIGNPAKLQAGTEITYPRVMGQRGEEDLYEWFVSNDQQRDESLQVALQPVVLAGRGKMEVAIKPLPRLPRPRGG